MKHLRILLLPLLPMLLVAVLGIAFGNSCSSKQSANSGAANADSDEAKRTNVITVTVAKSESREVAAYIQATGSLVAQETSNVAPKVAGKVANIYVNAGQFVAQGAVIAKIDDKDARQGLATAQASVKQAIATVRQAEARLGLSPNSIFNASTIPEVRAAAANLDQALAEQRQAEANEKRYRELVESGDVALIAYEQYRTARDTARAKTSNAKQLLETAVNTAKQNNQAIASAQAGVESARTQVAVADQELADTVIRAPFSGFVSERQTAVGEFVSTASIVATVLRTNPIKIQVQVGEADVPYVNVGRGISLQVDAYKDRNFAGSVSSVNPAVDPASRSAIIEGLIENGDNALRSGMFATVRINKQGANTTVFVPKSAVYNDQSTQSYRVFVIQEGVAKLRVVQLGTEEADSIQILTGVNADESVATSNLDKLYEGAKVSF